MNRMKLLMCRPDYYQVDYEINPWMHVDRKADLLLAKAQWENFHQTLKEKLHLKIELIDPVKGLPDMVFTANAGLVQRRFFVRSNFRFPQRREEEKCFETWFRKNGYIVKRIPQPAFFEGEGDALKMGEFLYMGSRFRSMPEAHESISYQIKTGFYSMELVDPRFYHLDTCFAPINDKTAVAFLPAFDILSQQILKDTIPDLIEVSEEEAVKFACNMVVSDEQVVMPQNCPNTQQALEKHGFRVWPLDFSEFIKSGGAAKCLTLSI